MLKLFCLLAILGGAAAAGAWLPIHGRTVLERWQAAPGPVAFVERAWAEARTAWAGPGAVKRPSAPQASRGSRPARPNRPAPPSETHTDQDRAALDRILAERAGR
jgi:hypothetical protein